jgi:hypothetical protein
VRKSNITGAVGACNTAECESKRQQSVNDARERMSAEKTELAEMTQKRMERERQSFEEQRWRQAVESQMAASADQAAQATENPIYYPTYPIAASGWPCRGIRANPRTSLIISRASACRCAWIGSSFFLCPLWILRL